MSKPIRRVAVLGAGVMGSGIAAHCANAGIPVVLEDRTLTSSDDLYASWVGLDFSREGERAGEWAAVKHARPIKPFSETVFGFFGMGQIGRAVHARLRGFGFSFIAADPALSPGDAAALGVETVDADTLLARADIVSLHAPSIPETIGFFNAERLGRMQPSAMIVNSARGQLMAATSVTAGTRMARKSLSRLWVRHIRVHSARTFSMPRSKKRRKPRASFICPKTGSTVAFRRA